MDSDIRADGSLLAASNALRTIACGLVVLIHVNITIRPGIGTWWPAGFLFAPFFALPVPAFFMLSGLFSGRFSSLVSRPSLIAFIRKKTRTLIIPFFFWNTLLLLFAKAHQLPVARLVYFSLTGFWQLYYISVLLQLLILHHLLESRIAGIGIRRIFGVAAALAVAFGATADYLLWTRGAGSAFMETELIGLFLPWSVFFAGGLWLRQEKPALPWLDSKRYWLLFLTVLAYALFYAGLRIEDDRIGYNPLQQFLFAGLPFRLLSPLLFLVLLNRLLQAGWSTKLMARLASGSRAVFGIYLSHTVVLTLLLAVRKTAGIETTHWIEVPVLWGMTWFISKGLVTLARASRQPWGVIFGMTGRRPSADERR